MAGTKNMSDIIHFLEANEFEMFNRALDDLTQEQRNRFFMHYKKLIELERMFEQLNTRMDQLNFSLNTKDLLSKTSNKKPYNLEYLLSKRGLQTK